MSEHRGIFSNDRRWWWTGAAWMPTRPPDGRSATWTGSQWVARDGPLGVGAVIGIAFGLGFVEFVWAIVLFLVITSEVNALWEARGRVGYESITDWPLSVPLLLTLLIVPIVVTILTAANVRCCWWVGALFLGGWPAIGLALIALASPGSGQLESAAAMGFILLVLLAIGWLVHLAVWRAWKLSADGQTWAQGNRSFSTVSSDGRWRWDGRTWQLASRPDERFGAPG